MSIKKNALGKGLSALLENIETDVTSKTDVSGAPVIVGAVANIAVDKIEANPFQPRTDFQEEALQELSDSIKEQGIIQPLTVRKLGYDKYQLISGERRLKASKLAGLQHVPAYIRIANDQAMLEMALVENIQREDLNAIEIAISYKRLIEECNLTHEELSKRVGKSRTTVTNFLRLLKLPAEIQIGIRDTKISMSHARTIINIDDEATQLAIYNDIINKQLSVRDVEELTRRTSTTKVKRTTTTVTTTVLPYEFQRMQERLSRILESPVEIKQDTAGTGKIIIQYLSDDDLKRILEVLNF